MVRLVYGMLWLYMTIFPGWQYIWASHFLGPMLFGWKHPWQKVCRKTVANTKNWPSEETINTHAAICSGFSHSKWWFSIAMLNYQRLQTLKIREKPLVDCHDRFPIMTSAPRNANRPAVTSSGVLDPNVSLHSQTWREDLVLGHV